MNRWTVLIMALVLGAFAVTSCSGGGGNPAAPPTSTEGFTEANNQGLQAHTYLFGYWDIFFDVECREFEVVENRTASYTLNIIPFLNLMASPPRGITFGSIVVHDDDPAFLGVDVDFQIHHPFPTFEQYRAYDLMGVVMGHGASFLEYEGYNLRHAQYGTDLYMKNADGYTRWFNPPEFPTELIFGWAPGGFQNLKGNANVNPYKYYAQDLAPTADVWEFLTSGDNNDGYFYSGNGRMMELEFPMPPEGIGLQFGYAAVVCWEELYDGPYYP